MMTKDKIKGIVFADLDGTLLDDMSGLIPETALYARKRLKENGYIFTLSTGRDMKTHYSIRYMDQLEPDAVINNNGAKITADGQLIFLHYMDEDLVRRIYEFCVAHDLCIGASIGDWDYFTHPELKIKSELTYKGKLERNFIPFEEIFRRGLRVITLSYAGDVHRYKSVLEKQFPEIELFDFAGGVGADVVQRGFSKAQGVMRVCDHYGVSLDQTYAIGDSANDVPMLRQARISIAMGNADVIARNAACYITDSVDRDGFYKAMQHFELI